MADKAEDIIPTETSNVGEQPTETATSPRRVAYVCLKNIYDGEVETKIGEKLLVALKDVEEFVEKGIIKIKE